ncbi:hypothetical protein FHS16_001764 [Paenibacillus endophyticus]|uniref:Uncharacterized protein n=1 Tax=Paenibacillus endophyticus TaxID=1294268 RepID=A0A7W5G9X7_9BACL|nr:hypothetical protein [Paenibacillus endophyticus]
MPVFPKLASKNSNIANHHDRIAHQIGAACVPFIFFVNARLAKSQQLKQKISGMGF